MKSQNPKLQADIINKRIERTKINQISPKIRRQSNQLFYTENIKDKLFQV